MISSALFLLSMSILFNLGSSDKSDSSNSGSGSSSSSSSSSKSSSSSSGSSTTRNENIAGNFCHGTNIQYGDCLSDYLNPNLELSSDGLTFWQNLCLEEIDLLSEKRIVQGLDEENEFISTYLTNDSAALLGGRAFWKFCFVFFIAFVHFVFMLVRMSLFFFGAQF